MPSPTPDHSQILPAEGQARILAGGGLVWRPGLAGREFEVVLVHRPAYDDWSFPKGKPRRGEPLSRAALREVEEETGLRCRLLSELPPESYLDSSGREKVVGYWEMAATAGSIRAANEVDDARWVPLGAAIDLLSYERDRAFLAGFRTGRGRGILWLLRHASAGERREPSGLDRTRPLDEEGRSQASSLIGRMAAQPLSLLLSSPHLRCVQTLEPIGAARGLPVESADALAEGSPIDAVIDLLRSVAPLGGTLLCTHADIVGGVVAALLEAGIRLEDGPESSTEKGAAWAFALRNGSLTSARYLAPASS